MCIACELSFWNMIDALPPEDQERILREQAARFACEADEGEPHHGAGRVGVVERHIEGPALESVAAVVPGDRRHRRAGDRCRVGAGSGRHDPARARGRGARLGRRRWRAAAAEEQPEEQGRVGGQAEQAAAACRSRGDPPAAVGPATAHPHPFLVRHRDPLVRVRVAARSRRPSIWRSRPAGRGRWYGEAARQREGQVARTSRPTGDVR